MWCINTVNHFVYYIDPIAYLDSGYWSTLGFVGTCYCNNQSSSLFNCLTSNSYYFHKNHKFR